MKKGWTKLRWLLPALFGVPVCAGAGEADVSSILFHHVLNSTTLELFPFLPPVPLPAGVTAHHVMLLLATMLILALFIPLFRKKSLKVSTPAAALEGVVLFVRDDIVFPVMGEARGRRWLPFFTTLFIFLLVTNYLGLIPAFKSATGNISVTTALAVLVLVIMFVTGIRNLGPGGFLRNMYPDGVARPVGLFVLVLEFLGLFIKIGVLSLRLFANMFAGHLAILSFLVLIFMISPFFTAVALPFAVFTYALEILVALIQALVFTLLSCIFISMAGSSH